VRVDLERIKEFHGHVGPYVVIGWRMGARAMAELGASKYFGATCHVRCADSPPQSCLIDGLQFSTGCTLGKRNITHTVGSPIEVRVTSKETGRTLVIRPKEEPLQRALALMRDEGEEPAVAWIETLDDDALMTVEDAG
jgi:formylmethanofuran dehydrogenase subunit E